jgi:diphthamide biosynthesis methyltransferase
MATQKEIESISSAMLVYADTDDMTLTMDLSSQDEVQEVVGKFKTIQESFSQKIESHIEILDDESDEEDLWIVVNIVIDNSGEACIDDIKQFIKEIENI